MTVDKAAGYGTKTFQFYAYRSQKSGTVAVYRWWHGGDRDWITLANGEIPDATLVSWGYVKHPPALFYAHLTKPSSGGYFELSAPQTNVLSPTGTGNVPHTFSVVELNRGGYRYWGYYGNNGCDIGLARSQDLVNWVQDPSPLFAGNGERWASVLNSGGIVQMVHTQGWCLGGNPYIVARSSTDGILFTSPSPVVQETDHHNGNPTLFRDPVGGLTYLYWYRQNGGLDEIRVKSGASFADLALTPSSVGQLLAYIPRNSPDLPSGGIVAAPQVMYSGGTYYMAVETKERGIWKTRILTSTSPNGAFSEIPGNPVYGNGAACVFQHPFGTTLHSYYCKEATPGSNNWSVERVTANLNNPQ